MSKAAYQKRLDRLTPPKAEKPTEHSTQDIVALFTELEADGVISAETLAAIHGILDNGSLDLFFECCTTKELHALRYLTGSPKDRQETVKQAHDPLWRNLRALDIEDMEQLDKLVGKYK